jgi:hypothetical protein
MNSQSLSPVSVAQNGIKDTSPRKVGKDSTVLVFFSILKVALL